jgi:hypothetical protein
MDKKEYIEVSEVQIVREPKVLEYQEFVAIIAAYIHRIYFGGIKGNLGNDLTLRAEDYEWNLDTQEEYNKVCSDVVKRLYKITVDD